MMQNPKKFIVNHWPIIFITIMSFLLPAIWLRERLIIAYNEPGFVFFFNPVKLFNSSKYIWWDSFFLGIDWTRKLVCLPYYLLTSGLQFLEFPAIARQYLFFSAILFLSALAMYLLAIELFPDKDKKTNFFAFVVAMFYVLNPYSMHIWHRFTRFIFILPFLPLVFLVTVKILKKFSFKYAFLFAIVVLLFSPVGLEFFIPLFIPVVFYVIFEAMKRRRFVQWKYFGLTIFLTIGLNLWWILPFPYSIQDIFNRSASLINPLGSLIAISKRLPLLYIFRLIDNTTINWYGVSYHPGWIEFLIPLLAVIAILSGIKRNKNVLFFSLLLIIGLFLTKGLQPPGGFIYEWAFLYIPFFKAFRNPFGKFGLIVAFSYSFLVPLGIYNLWQLIRNRALRVWVTSLILILLFGVSIWPMWTGDVFSFWQGHVIYRGVKEIPSTKVKIPDYWHEASEFINIDQENYRIVFLPLVHGDAVWYKWKHGYLGTGYESVSLLFNKPVISQFFSFRAEMFIKMVFNNIFLTDPNSCLPLLGLMNTRYILVRNDIEDKAFKKTVPLAKTHQLLDSMKPIHKVKSFGKLDLYKVPDDYWLPHIYSSTTPTLVAGSIENLPSLAKAGCFKGKPALFFDMEKENKRLKERKDMLRLIFSNNRWKLLDRGMEIKEDSERSRKQVPKIMFRKINPTKYEVRAREANEPFWLVFSESFHKGWRLYNKVEVKEDGAFGEIVADYPKLGVKEARHLQKFTPGDIRYLFRKADVKEHYLVNGYANAWYIDPEKLGLGEDFTLVMYFWPQTLFYLGLLISGLTLLCCIGYLLWKRRR